MSQYENGRGSGAGRSRAKGNSRSTGRASAGKGSRSSTGSGAGRSSYNRNTSAGRGKGGRGGGQDSGYLKLAIGGVVLILAIVCIVYLVKGMGSAGFGEKETETTTPPETELQREVMVEGVNITGMSREEAKDAITAKFNWDMQVVWEDQTCQIPDLMAGKVDDLLDEIYEGEPKESYLLDTSGLEEAVTAEAAKVAEQLDKKPKNGSISGYDKDSDTFTFAGAENGRAVDQELLKNDILAAVNAKDFDAQIQASVSVVEPEISEATAREKYKTLSSVTTKTTSNSKRNTNVRLSCEAINGIVLQPGEEFSFNERVGERTEAKGYKGAAAYNNGEVVEEIGGGVCQTSSTLYNAVVKAGLKTTMRRSHTFEPSYVTPGTDATVSWGGPDYKFVNNSSTAIGIRASYGDQKCTISIYGIPILEEGVTYSLKSTKLKDIDPPAPTYEEDGTLPPGTEKVKSSGSKGSYWETRLVITKDGEVISQEVDHNVTYKGHAPVILRNTSETMAPGATMPSTETIIDPNTLPSDPGGEMTPGSPVTGPGNGPGAGNGSGSNDNSGAGSGSGNGPGTPAETQTAAPTPTNPETADPAPGTGPTAAPSQPEVPAVPAGPPAAPGNGAQMVTPGPTS